VTAANDKLNGRDDVRRICLHKLGDGAIVRVPEVQLVAESHGEYVLRTPVEEIKIIVIDEVGCVEDPLRSGGDCANRNGGVLLLGVHHAHLVACGFSSRRSF
jgi:hypothetical protein